MIHDVQARTMIFDFDQAIQALLSWIGKCKPQSPQAYWSVSQSDPALQRAVRGNGYWSYIAPFRAISIYTTHPNLPPLMTVGVSGRYQRRYCHDRARRKNLVKTHQRVCECLCLVDDILYA